MPQRTRPTHAQRAWQREFRDWLAANRHRFHTERAIRAHLAVRHVQVFIAGLNPLLSIRVRPWNIGVDVAWQGRPFDRLFDLDLDKVRTAGGFHACSGCMDFMAAGVQGPVQQFRSLAALRAQHQYEAWLDWCNDELFPARRIEMVSTSGGSAGASLTTLDDSPGVALPLGFCCFHLPVWVDGSATANT